MRIKEMICQLKELLTVKQIHHVGTMRNVQRTVWGICTLMLGHRGLRWKIEQGA